MKKIFLMFFLVISLVFITKLEVNADSTVLARIGNNYYDTLQDAIKNASSNDVITIVSDISLDETIEINKNVNINLNNHNISAKEKVFLVQGGSLNITGKGTVKEISPYYGAIVMIGSSDPNDVDYSTVSISKDVKLEGWSGILVDHENKKSYGVLVNMNGKINALDDTSGGSGAGIYVNGYIAHSENAPIVNLNETAVITSTGVGVYSAGNANYYINGAYIEGVEAGLGIKSGSFKILDGTIYGTGEDKTPTSGNNDGINPSGAGIQIESNNSYYGNISLDISDGTIRSNNSYAIYEYTVNGASTKIKDILLSGGTYLSKSGYPVLKMSDSFNGTHQGFIKGGTYTTNPSSYLEEGYSTSLNTDSLYEVVNKDMTDKVELNSFKKENSSDNNVNNNGLIYSLIATIVAVFGMFIYMYWFNKNK